MNWKIPTGTVKEKLQIVLSQIEKETGFHIIDVQTDTAAYNLQEEFPYYICNFHIMETPGVRYALWYKDWFGKVKEQINKNETLWTDYYSVPTNTEWLFFCELDVYVDKFKPTYGNFVRGIYQHTYIKKLNEQEIKDEIKDTGIYFLNDIPDIITFIAKHPIKSFVYLGRGIEGIQYEMSSIKILYSYLKDKHINNKYKRKDKKERRKAEKKSIKFAKKLKGYNCFVYDTGSENFTQIFLVCRHKDNITSKQINNANKLYEKWYYDYKHYGRYFHLEALEYEPEENELAVSVHKKDNKCKKYIIKEKNIMNNEDIIFNNVIQLPSVDNTKNRIPYATKYTPEFKVWLSIYAKERTIDEIVEGVEFYYPQYTKLYKDGNFKACLSSLLYQNNIKYKKKENGKYNSVVKWLKENMNSNTTCENIVNKIKLEKPEYNDLLLNSNKKLYYLLNRYNINYKKLTQEEKIKKLTTNRKESKYSDEFVNWIKIIAKNKCLSEIQSLIKQYYPEYTNLYKSTTKNGFSNNLYTFLNYRKIKYNKQTNKSKKSVNTTNNLKSQYPETFINWLKIVAQYYNITDLRNLVKEHYPEYTTLHTDSETALKSLLRRNNIKTVRVSKNVYSSNFIKSIKSNCENLYISEIKSFIKQYFPQYKTLYEGVNSSQALYKFLTTHNLKYKKGRKNTKIYTEDVINTIKQYASPDLSVKELVNKLNGVFPDKNISGNNIYPILKVNNIPYKTIGFGKGQKTNITNDEPVIILKRENNINIPEVRLNVDKIITREEKEFMEQISNEPKQEKEFMEQISNEPKVNRYQKEEEEVTTVTENRFKKTNCYIDTHYTTQDYINVLQLLSVLSNGIDTYISKRVDQVDIMNMYQIELFHEIENEELPEGDTYFQDKGKVMRLHRRYIKEDLENLKVLKPLIESIDKRKLNKAVKELEKLCEQRQNYTFIPLVDTDMVKKYTWAKSGQLGSPKAEKTLLTTNKQNKKRQVILNTYRASCTISGSGYGTFRRWIQDIKSENIDNAKQIAEYKLTQLKEKTSGIYISDFEVHQINT